MNDNTYRDEKHFDKVQLYTALNLKEYKRVLDDTFFGDITFEKFEAFKIDKIMQNAFNKTADQIKEFMYPNCALAIDIFNVIKPINHLTSLILGLNVTEIPTNTFNSTKITNLEIKSHENLVIKSDALKFDTLEQFRIYETTIQEIQRNALKFNYSVHKGLYLTFEKCKLTGQTFQNGSFDAINGANKAFSIVFDHTNINYLAEGAFKIVLYKGYWNRIDLRDNQIDCEDCKNYWMIKEKLDKQVLGGYCQGSNNTKSLFDEIKSKLSQKCK